jgi:type I restriction enzyme S subunit
MGMSVTWENRLLRDICQNVQYGHTASATDEPIGPKFLRITDIVPETIDWPSVPHCEIEPKKKGKYLLKKGDIVIARTGATTGYAKYIKAAPESIFASYLVRLQLINGVDPRYVGYVVESDVYKEFIQANWGGAAQPNANAQILTSFHVPTPPLPTQRKIATILSAYDELIENNLRRIKILEEMAQNLYREWFVKFRFPGHQHTRFTDSPLGQIPEGWEVRMLGEIVELKYGKALKKEDRRGGNVPVYGSSGVVGYHDVPLVNGPGIVVGRKGNVGSVYWSDESFFPIDTAYFVTSKMPLRFLFYDLQTKNFLNNDAAVPGLNRNQAYSLETVTPPEDIMTRFCQFANDFERQAAVLRLQNTTLRRTRDLLLPRLISGEVDVSELDIAVPEEAIA